MGDEAQESAIADALCRIGPSETIGAATGTRLKSSTNAARATPDPADIRRNYPFGGATAIVDVVGKFRIGAAEPDTGVRDFVAELGPTPWGGFE